MGRKRFGGYALALVLISAGSVTGGAEAPLADLAERGDRSGIRAHLGRGVEVDGAQVDGTNYYVRNTNVGVKLSLKATGNAYYDVQGSTVSLRKIRLIGDQKSSEVDTNCSASLFGPNPTTPRLPSVNATKVGNTKDVDVWFCDSGNGGAIDSGKRF